MDILTGRRVGHTPFPRVRAIFIAAESRSGYERTK